MGQPNSIWSSAKLHVHKIQNLRIFIFHKPRHRHHSDEKRHIAIRKVLILKDKGLRRLLLLGTFIDTDIKDLENDGAK
uniref:Uncharacterized protein n=1 Tax=Cucumis sativus TaxID=3659 RepID=A0A0A0LA54_CUCSA